MLPSTSPCEGPRNIKHNNFIYGNVSQTCVGLLVKLGPCNNDCTHSSSSHNSMENIDPQCKLVTSIGSVTKGTKKRNIPQCSLTNNGKPTTWFHNAHSTLS